MTLLDSNTSIVVFRNAAVRRGGNLIWSNGTFSIPTGTISAIVGSNGAGKTTLLNVELGLLPLTQGEVTVLGKPAGVMNHSIGYVPQDYASDIDSNITAEQSVELGLYGARGFIDNDGINIPKSIETDSFMRYHGFPILRRGTNFSNPTLNEFDAIICPATYDRLFYLLSTKKDMFIGVCMDSLDPKLGRAKLNLEHFKLIVQTMYRINMEYSKESFDRGMKEIHLLKKTW